MVGEHQRELLLLVQKASRAIKKSDVKVLRFLSEECVRLSSVMQDPSVVTLAVLLYSYSKLFERQYYSKYTSWENVCYSCFTQFDAAIAALRVDDFGLFQKEISASVRLLQKVEPQFKKHIEDVFHKARVTKGADVYAKGLSLGRTASLLGISSFELMDYLGVQRIADTKEHVSMPVMKRLDYTRELFS